MTHSTADTMNRRPMLADVGLVAGGGIALVAPAPTAVRGYPRRPGLAADVAPAWADLSLRLVQSTPGFTPLEASRAFAYTGSLCTRASSTGRLGIDRWPVCCQVPCTEGHRWPVAGRVMP
jgi:hypothetical protein